MANTRARQRKPKSPKFDPVFTDEQLQSFEENHNETWGVKRRITMMALSRTSDQLIDGFSSLVAEGNSDSFFALLEQITDYRDHLKSGVELADAAFARLVLVGKYVTEGAAA